MAKKGENIYRRKDGRWEGRYIKGRKENGKPHYGYVYGYKYKEVKARLLPLKCCYAGQQTVYARFNGTLNDWVRCYMEGAMRSRIKSSTYTYYHGLLHGHILPALGSKKLTSIVSDDVRGFVDLLEEKGLSPNSIRGIFAMLNRVIKSEVKKNILITNPCADVELPNKEVPQIEPLNRDAQRRLEVAALADEDGIAVMLALYTGMRIGEISALQWSDVDLDAGVLHVNSTVQRIPNMKEERNKTSLIFDKPKSLYSNRVIPLTAKLIELLEAEQKKTTSNYVVSCQDSFAEPRTVRYRYYRIVRAAGISPIHFHGLRHTFATRCIETGMDVASLSRILGHSSIKMTLDIYTGATMEHKIASMQKLDTMYDKALPAAG